MTTETLPGWKEVDERIKAGEMPPEDFARQPAGMRRVVRFDRDDHAFGCAAKFSLEALRVTYTFVDSAGQRMVARE